MGQYEFENYYQEIYLERWPKLLQALRGPEARVARMNSLSSLAPGSAELGGEIPRLADGLLQHYVLDPASVFAAEQLPLKIGDRALDMCAAPGGKSLVLAQRLFAGGNTSGELILNEISAGRRDRLTKVVQNYIPQNIRGQVWVKGKDAALYGLKEPESFDAILLDAPCSGERHLLENSSELEVWSKKRTEGLAQKQYALLASALMAVKPGGSIVYSTCSISPLENDGVVAHLQKKKQKKMPFRIMNLWQENLTGIAEQTEHGIFFAPDLKGWGPMYVSALQRL